MALIKCFMMLFLTHAVALRMFSGLTSFYTTCNSDVDCASCGEFCGIECWQGPCHDGTSSVAEGTLGNFCQPCVECHWDSDAVSGNCDACQNPCQSHSANTAGVEGDPHVVNMAGQKYDIVQTGTFSFLTLTRKADSLPLLVFKGAIDHVDGTPCSPTFVSNVSLHGQWIEDGKTLGVRVNHWVDKDQALEFGSDGHWQNASKPFEHHPSVAIKQSSTRVVISTHGINFKFGLGLNRRHHGKAKHYFGYNFLNLKVEGLGSLKSLDDQMSIAGLLGNDDFSALAREATECQKQPSFVTVGESAPKFLSAVIASAA